MAVRGLGAAIALALTGAVLASCGGSQQSESDGRAKTPGRQNAYERKEVRLEERARKMGYNARQAEAFVTGWLVCGEEPKSEFAAGSVGLPADSSDRAIAHGYADEWPPKLSKAVFAGCLRGLATVPTHFPASSPSARAIWGRNFLVVSVTSDHKSEDPPLVEPYRIRFWFSSERDHAVSWHARCNSTGADARFTARRVEIKRTFTTLIGCQAGPGREDTWLDRFMESNPEWRLSGENLRLSSDRATIELRGFRDPDKCLIPPSAGWIDFGDSKFDCESALNFVTLHVEGKDNYYPGWRCRDTELANGRLRVTCWDGKERFTVHGFDREFYKQRTSFEE